MSMTDKPPIDEQEWAAQERGMRAALEAGTAGMDAATVNYGIVARALVSVPRDEPPADFAAAVTKRIARDEAGAERLPWRILLAVLAFASIIACVRYGGQWWQPLHRSFGDEALGWMLAVTVCMALSWTSRQLLELAAHGPTRSQEPARRL